MNIDEKTGLPELPEGYFWRIREDRVSIMKPLPDGDWSEEDPYDYWGGNWETRTRKVVREVSRKWYEFFKPTHREVTIRERRKVNRVWEVAYEQPDVTGELAVIPSKYYRGLGIAPTRIYDKREPVTKENLMTLCERALKKMEDLSLYGDYPPKRLGGE